MEDVVVERTFNTKVVREILSDETLKDRVTLGGDVDMFDPEHQPQLYYILITVGGKDIGFLLFHIINNMVCYQIHANYLPRYWGMGLSSYTQMAIKWMFENTDALKIVAFCPSKYPEARKHALKIGFSEEGVLTKSSLFNGELYDNYIMGISK